MVTIRDVAKKAGVSVATVSCALNGTKQVRPETRSRVLEAARALDYIPNSSARNLKIASSKVIGVILTDIKSQFHVDIFNSLSSYLQQRGYTIQVAFSNELPGTERENIRLLLSQNVCGLFLVTCQPEYSNFFASQLLKSRIPVIFMERVVKRLTTNYIGYNNYNITHELVTRLLNQGYRKIALVCGSLRFSSESDCVRGYAEAYSSAGTVANSDFICYTNMTKENSFQAYLKKFHNNPPEAVLCTNREITDGALLAIQYCGLKTPENLIVISFGEETWDNIAYSSGVYVVSRSASYMGELAAKKMLELLQEPNISDSFFIEMDDPALPADFPPVSTLKRPLTGVRDPSRKLRILSCDIGSLNALRLLCTHFIQKTGISLEFTVLPQSQLLERISESFSSLTDSFDLYTYDAPWLEYMVQNLCLSELREFIDSSGLDTGRFFAESRYNCMLGDRIYGIPITAGSQILFYRADLFEDPKLMSMFQEQYRISLRPPRTWTEFNNIAKFFTKKYNEDSPTEYGTSLAGGPEPELSPEIMMRLWGFGGGIWDNYGQPSLNTVANANAMANMIQTLNYVKPESMESTIVDTVDDFCNGKTAMLLSFTEFAQKISFQYQRSLRQRIGFYHIPSRRTASAGWNLGLNPFSPHREEAFEFLSWVCEQKTSFLLAVLNGAPQFVAPYHNHDLQRMYPWLPYSEASVHTSQKRNPPYQKNRLSIPPNAMDHILCTAFRKIVSSRVSISSALEEAQAEAARIYTTYGHHVRSSRH